MNIRKHPSYLLATLSLFGVFGIEGCAGIDGQREQSLARLPHQRLTLPSPSSFPSWNFGELEEPRVVRGLTVLPHTQNIQTVDANAVVMGVGAESGGRVAPSFEAAYSRRSQQGPGVANTASGAIAGGDSVPPQNELAEKRLVTFDFASSAPDRSAELVVREVMLLATDSPSIKVTGRTDDSGDPARNERLARARALAIKRLLVRAGVKEDRIQISSCSDCFIRSNATEVGRKQNRSVEIEIARPIIRKR
jgi:outer membrane protein OmpA-like peptidoglycan-associated protein